MSLLEMKVGLDCMIFKFVAKKFGYQILYWSSIGLSCDCLESREKEKMRFRGVVVVKISF